MLPKEVGGLDGIAICEKPPAEAAVEIAEAKCQEVTTLCHKILPLPTFARLLGFVGDSCFSSKKLPKGVKDLKAIRPDAQN